MNVCFVTHGDIQSIATLKRATGMAGPLIQANHQVSLILQDTPNNRDRLALECPNVKPLFFDDGSPVRQVLQKRSLLKQAKARVVWVCGIGARNWVCRAVDRRETIMLVEQQELLSAVPQRRGVRSYLELMLEYSTLFFFDGQICASRYLQNIYSMRMRRVNRKQPILYSPYAFNTDLLLRPPKDIEMLKSLYAGKKVLLYIGRLVANYGLFQMLDSVSDLRRRRRDFVLLVIGEGPHMERAAQYIVERALGDSVKLLGHIPEDNLPSYFHLADAFLCPLQDTRQDWARCPSKLFMFLPFQKPIVTCRIGEAAELFGEYEFYFEPGDVKMLSQKIDQALYKPDTWRPRWNASEHSWKHRVHQFVRWLDEWWGVN